jgi:hypothetical protein
MNGDRITAFDRIRTVVSAFGWAVAGGLICAPMTLLAGAYWAIVCAVLYGKVGGVVVLHWGLVGIIAGGLMGFAGRLIEGHHPLADEPVRWEGRRTSEPARWSFRMLSPDVMIHAFSVRRRT